VRRRIIRSVGACLLMTAAANGAGAAPSEPTPPRVPDWRQSHFEEANQGIFAMYYFATCSRITRRGTTEALLAAREGSAEEREHLQTLVDAYNSNSQCRSMYRSVAGFQTRNRFGVRGALAEAMYNGTKYKPRKDSQLPFSESYVPTSALDDIAVPRWVSRCAVHRDPAGAHAVLQHNPGSVGEGRGLRALNPAFLACLPADQRLVALPRTMRFLIAEQLYVVTQTHPEAFTHA
jgi:hypothetical protein